MWPNCGNHVVEGLGCGFEKLGHDGLVVAEDGSGLEVVLFGFEEGHACGNSGLDVDAPAVCFEKDWWYQLGEVMWKLGGSDGEELESCWVQPCGVEGLIV